MCLLLLQDHLLVQVLRNVLRNQALMAKKNVSSPISGQTINSNCSER